jgi:sugar phosphate isomerase/epimerase
MSQTRRKIMFRSLSPGALGIGGLSFMEAMDLAKATGYQGIDVDLGYLTKLMEETSAEDVKKLFADKGLKMGAWGLPMNWRAVGDDYNKGLENLRKFAKTAQALGCTRLATWILPFSDDTPLKENFDFHVKQFKPIGEVLAEFGCSLGLEFIGPKTMRVGKKYEFVYTIGGMLELCDAIGTGNMGLLLDAWHWYTSHGTLDDLKKLKPEQVVHIHINDAPAGIPIDEQVDNVRCLPGETGVIDLVGFLKCLDAIKCEAPVTPEPFSKKLSTMTATEAAKTTSDLFIGVWKKAGLS